MGKRKQNKEVESKRKRLRQEKDSQLSSGLFSSNKNESASEEDDNNNEIIDWDNEEQYYELKPRNVKNGGNTVEGLPIKKADGKIERVVRQVVENDNIEEEKEEEPTEGAEDIKDIKDDIGEEDESLTPRERLTKIKEEVADLASKLIEDPEENVLCLTRLRKMSESQNMVTCQLSMLALIPVFKSLAPTYKIRPLSDTEKREKVSKEVARLRQFEQSLVNNYTLYVNNLSKLAKVSYLNSQNNRKITPEQVKKGQLAAKAACELCTSSLRYFNHRNEVISVVVRRLNRRPNNTEDLEIFTKCLRVLETLLKDDEENGDISFDITRILCTSIRDKQFRVDESVINIFLALSLLEDYDPNHNKEDSAPKLKKKDRVHLSKKERKARKERKEIDEEMRKAEQTITIEEREKYQAQVLKMLLTLYLEILRAGSYTSISPNNSASDLMASVLEGLARFGQMANLDSLGDFLEVLREIMVDIMGEHSFTNDNEVDSDIGGMYDGKQIRTILLCIATSFTLVTNHSSTGKLPMTIDLSKFVSSLYNILCDMSIDCDLEFSHKSLRLADPLQISASLEKPSVNVSTKSELLLRCLDFIFFRSRNGTLPRATSFTKRLYLSVLQTPEKTSLASLKFIGKLMGRYGESLKGLWNTEERISGEGSYILGIERTDREVELERCNSEAATLWENVLLDKHYCPMVKDGSRSLMKNCKSDDRR